MKLHMLTRVVVSLSVWAFSMMSGLASCAGPAVQAEQVAVQAGDQLPSGPTVDGSDRTRPDLKWERAAGIDINCDGIRDDIFTTQDET